MNLPEKLAREIARVTEIRNIYAELPAEAKRLGLGNPVVTAPQVMMMDAALEVAKRAAGSNDIETMIAAIKDLEGYEE